MDQMSGGAKQMADERTAPSVAADDALTAVAERPESADTATGWPALLAAPYGLRLMAVSAGIGLHAFNEVAIAPVLPLAMEALGGVTLLPLIYAAFFTLVIAGGLSAAPLRRRFGARRALMLAGLLYCAGILLQVSAPSAPLLLAGRAVQGLADGWIVALCYTLIADLFPSRLVPRVFSTEAVVWAMAAILGPFAGGLVVQHLGWRPAFAVSLPLLALFFLAMPFALPRDGRAKVPIVPHRLLPPRLFGFSSTVGRGSWLLLLMTGGQCVSTVFLAYTLHHRLQLSPVEVGLVLITLSLSWSVTAIPIGGIRTVERRQAILRIGPLSQVLGAALVANGLYFGFLPLVLAGQALNGAAFAMVFGSASQAIIEDADPEHRMTTSALLPSVETGGYVIGASFLGGIGPLFNLPARLAAEPPAPQIFALWGVTMLMAAVSLVAARGVRLKPPGAGP
ncbi:Predicted arabinose efflux permease, MFS family [Rhizobium sp. RU35A]|nr:Predicted arabinose efflux permease, MFS family [Rhizobium sp. RU35A]